MFMGPIRTLSLRVIPNSHRHVCFGIGTRLTFSSTQSANEFQSP